MAWRSRAWEETSKKEKKEMYNIYHGQMGKTSKTHWFRVNSVSIALSLFMDKHKTFRTIWTIRKQKGPRFAALSKIWPLPILHLLPFILRTNFQKSRKPLGLKKKDLKSWRKCQETGKRKGRIWIQILWEDNVLMNHHRKSTNRSRIVIGSEDFDLESELIPDEIR